VLIRDSVFEVRHRIWDTKLYAYSSNIIIDNVSFSAQARNEFPFVLLDNATLSLTNSTFDGIIASVHADFWSRTDVTARITGCDFTGSDAGLWMHDYYYNESMDIDFTEDSIVEGNSFSGEGCDLVCQFHLIDRMIGSTILTNGARFYAMYDLNTLVVDKPEGSGYIQRDFVLDDEMLSLAEELLDEEWDSWQHIFVEGDTVSMTVVDPDPITMMMKDEYYLPNHNRAWWVIGFGKVDPTLPLIEVPAPHWEAIGPLISELIADRV